MFGSAAARTVARGFFRPNMMSATNATSASSTTMRSAFAAHRSAAANAQQPARAVGAPVFLFGSFAIPIGLTIVFTKLGIADSKAYQAFETNVIEKKLLRKMSSVGKEKAERKRKELQRQKDIANGITVTEEPEDSIEVRV